MTHAPDHRSRHAKRAAAVMLACLSGLGLPAPAQAELRLFGNWIVGCDNRAECTAIGTAVGPADPGAPTVAIRIGVDRTSLSGFSFALIRLTPDSADTRPIIIGCLRCAHGPGTGGRDGAERIELVGQRVDVTEMRGARWLDDIGRGRPVSVSWTDGSAGTTIETAAFLEAWKHLAQLRGNLLRETPLEERLPVQQGRSLADADPPAAPAIEVMPSGSPVIEPVIERCPASTDRASLRQFALPGGVSLWGIACSKGGTTTLHWFQSAGSATGPVPLELPDADRGSLDAGRQGFSASTFDFDFGILRARSGPPDRADCGTQRAWRWMGDRWLLLERREMPVCLGLEPVDWVRTYASP